MRKKRQEGPRKQRREFQSQPTVAESLPFESSVGNVRLAVKLVREAALLQIPDLDEVVPPTAWWDWPQDDPKPWQTWRDKATARAKEAAAWRDRLTELIGPPRMGAYWFTKNRRAPNAEWNAERLREELGYVLVGPDGKPEPSWGPPESLLGEFVENDENLADPIGLLSGDYGNDPRLDGMRARRDYLPGNHPVWYVSGDGVANPVLLTLGKPPRHLMYPAYRTDLTGDTEKAWEKEHAGKRYLLSPGDWPEYASIIMTQCLIERARALELCAWCDARIEAWESAYYPSITIGPANADHHCKVTVTIAGTPWPNMPPTIIESLARDLGKILAGVELDNADAQAGKLKKKIPPLRDFLIRDGDRRYRLPLAMRYRIKISERPRLKPQK